VITIVEVLVMALLVFGAVELFARWNQAREERRQRLLEESWALYRASRRIHDETAAALQSMLDEARRTRSGDGA
jgi:Tfp pilus assembly protein PilN